MGANKSKLFDANVSWIYKEQYIEDIQATNEICIFLVHEMK